MVEWILAVNSTEDALEFAEVLQSNHVLEYIANKCDGSTITSQKGDTITFEDCDNEQDFDQTAHEHHVTGSAINYRPPEGTEFVEYTYTLHRQIGMGLRTLNNEALDILNF